MNTVPASYADDYPDQLPNRLPLRFCIALGFSLALAGLMLWAWFW